jgi:hypothetical protein
VRRHYSLRCMMAVIEDCTEENCLAFVVVVVVALLS